jgi:hypothetical protein
MNTVYAKEIVPLIESGRDLLVSKFGEPIESVRNIEFIPDNGALNLTIKNNLEALTRNTRLPGKVEINFRTAASKALIKLGIVYLHNAVKATNIKRGYERTEEENNHLAMNYLHRDRNLAMPPLIPAETKLVNYIVTLSDFLDKDNFYDEARNFCNQVITEIGKRGDLK